MNLPFRIAKRYFFSRKSGGAFNLITILSGISLLGYFVGAAALVLVLSVFNGFEGMFQSMYNNFDPQIRVVPANGKVFEPDAILKRIKAINGIEKYALVLEENVLLKYGDRQNIATIKGVDEHYMAITSLDSCMVAGDYLLEYGDTNFALVGQGIAWQLGVDPSDIFQRLVVFVPKRGETDVLNPEGSFTKMGILPAGVFSVQEEVDNKFVLVPIRFLRPLLERETEVSAIELKLAKGVSVSTVQSQLAEASGSEVKILNRYEQREGFYKVLRSEKLISYIILFFILIIATSNSIGSLYILVMEKKKDIGMLAALGLEKNQIAFIFKWNSLFIATVGGVSGILAGVVLCYLQEQYGFVKLHSGEVFSTAYPVALKVTDLAVVLFTVCFIGYITSLYPVAKAKKLVA